MRNYLQGFILSLSPPSLPPPPLSLLTGHGYHTTTNPRLPKGQLSSCNASRQGVLDNIRSREATKRPGESQKRNPAVPRGKTQGQHRVSAHHSQRYRFFTSFDTSRADPAFRVETTDGDFVRSVFFERLFNVQADLRFPRFFAPRTSSKTLWISTHTDKAGRLHRETESVSVADESQRFHKGVYARFVPSARVFNPHHQARTRVAQKYVGGHRAATPVDGAKGAAHELRYSSPPSRMGTGSSPLVRPFQSPPVSCRVARL